MIGEVLSEIKDGTVFVGFLCLVSFRGDALCRIGVQVDYLLNGPGAFIFFKILLSL